MSYKEFQNKRIVFFGTPDFACPTLELLLENTFNVVGVVTQPDKPKGRKQVMHAPPVKKVALKHGIPFFQPKRIKKNLEFEKILSDLNPDVCIVIAYGKIIPQNILDIPKIGFINIHGSILPQYRGASPIQEAIKNGDTKTGITIMHMNAGMDTGDIISIEECAILPTMTSQELHDDLSIRGAQAMLNALPAILNGTAKKVPQDDSLATYCSIIKKEDGLINWENTAQTIYNQIRAFTPWPGCYTFYNGKRLKIKNVKPLDNIKSVNQPGFLYRENSSLIVQCNNNSALEIFSLQIEGKKEMSTQEFLNGYEVDVQLLSEK